jgi:hypothetical protein
MSHSLAAMVVVVVVVTAVLVVLKTALSKDNRKPQNCPYERSPALFSPCRTLLPGRARSDLRRPVPVHGQGPPGGPCKEGILCVKSRPSSAKWRHQTKDERTVRALIMPCHIPLPLTAPAESGAWT